MSICPPAELQARINALEDLPIQTLEDKCELKALKELLEIIETDIDIYE